jgi:mannose-1-phosphate guanylyltransferase
VGDFHTLGQVLGGDRDSNVVVGAAANATEKSEPIFFESRRCVLVPQSGRLVALLGINDAIVVDTPDVLMVCSRERAQDVKALVEEAADREDGRFL